jgi:hypothetical protein
MRALRTRNGIPDGRLSSKQPAAPPVALGGRPRKSTQAEARAAALEELVPAAIKSLAAHLGDGDPVAWRAALRVFELSYGKPAETVELDLDIVDPLHVAEMTAPSGPN